MPTHDLLPPHLIELNGQKTCSVCKQIIEPKDGSLSKGFRAHVEEKHKPKSYAKKK